MIEKNWDQYKDLEYYPDRVCVCGRKIKVRSHHKYGIPKYCCSGHSYMGKTRSGEFCGNLSKTRKGGGNPMFGKHPSIETIEKRKESTRRTVKERGYTFSGEAIEKIRKSKIGDKNPAKRPEVREKMKKVSKEVQNRPEVKERSRETAIKQWEDPEVREKTIKTLKIVQNRPEVKEKHRNFMVECWKDPEYREKQIRAIFKGMNRKPSKLEDRLLSFFEKYNLDFKYSGTGALIVGGKVPDFYFFLFKDKLVEVGNIDCYRVFKPNITKQKYTRSRKKHFAKYGFQTLVIWDEELSNEAILLARVKKFLRKGTVLVASHCDDELIGTYSFLKKIGVESVIYVESDLERRKEALRCAKQFGFTPIFLSGVDELEDRLLELNPSVVFTHDLDDLHPLHKLVSKIVQVVSRKSNYQIAYYSVDMNTGYIRELSKEKQEEKREMLNRIYSSQSSLWENDWRYYDALTPPTTL